MSARCLPSAGGRPSMDAWRDCSACPAGNPAVLRVPALRLGLAAAVAGRFARRPAGVTGRSELDASASLVVTNRS